MQIVKFKPVAVVASSSTKQLLSSNRKEGFDNKLQSSANSEMNSKESHLSNIPSSQANVEDWGSDDDDSLFLSVDVDTLATQASNNILDQNNSVSVEEKIQSCSQHEKLPSAVQEFAAPLPVKRKFPGPAGLLLPPSPSPSPINVIVIFSIINHTCSSASHYFYSLERQGKASSATTDSKLQPHQSGWTCVLGQGLDCIRSICSIVEE